MNPAAGSGWKDLQSPRRYLCCVADIVGATTSFGRASPPWRRA